MHGPAQHTATGDNARGCAATRRVPLNLLDAVVVAALIGLAVPMARMPIMTPDVWWHLATGRWIAAHGIPHADPFSYTLAGAPWTAHEWLADQVWYGAYSKSGLVGIVWLRALLLVLATGVTYVAARAHAGTFVATLAVAPAIYAWQRNWLDRPQLVTFVLAPLLLVLLEASRRRPRLLLALPVVFGLWANLHGGFMIGLALFGGWMLCERIAARRREPAAPFTWRVHGVALVCSALAVCANPNFLAGATYPLRYVVSGLRTTVQEERAGALDSPYAWVHFVLLLSLWMTLAVRARRAPLAHLALALGLGWLSMPRYGAMALPFAAERHAPLLLLVGAPLLAWHASAGLGLTGVERQLAQRLRGAIAWAVGGAIIAAACLWTSHAMPRDADPGARVLPGRFPQVAARWLAANRLPGNLINPYRWGGYLTFALWPDYRVWIDSRGDLYGAGRLREADLLQRVPTDSEVRALLERYDANVIVWHLLTLDFGPLQVHPFANWLLDSPSWRLVFFDRFDPARPQHPACTTGVFLRVHERNRDLLARYPRLETPALPGRASALR